jgi:uncharacterized protein involved in exopolysaccharide biosynthesis
VISLRDKARTHLLITTSQLLNSLTTPIARGNSHAHSPPPPEPSFSPVSFAIGRHKLLVFMCAAALAVVGALGGAARKGTYTASTTLQVGKVNPNSPGFYGFVQSASDLAGVFSRAITAAPVLAAVHSQLGLAPGQAVARLAAEPLPSSPAFRVIATGPTPRAAVSLANVTSNALIAYEAQANTYSPESQRMLDEYRKTSLALAHANMQVSRAASAYGAHRDPARRLNLERAEAERAAASLQVQALASGYQLSAQSTTTRDLISLLAGASIATSDRKSKVELLGFIGLLGGLVIGAAIAVLYEQRRGIPRSG